MLPAITILWCLAALTATWGASLIVRGIAGGRANSPSLTSVIILAATASSIASGWLAFTVAQWTGAAGAGLGLAAGVIFITWVVGDRSKARNRCPACWYDMSGTPTPRCPECGHDTSRPARLLRTRRRRALIITGITLALSGYLLGHERSIRTYGWFGAVPTTVLKLGWKWLPIECIHAEAIQVAESNTGKPPTQLQQQVSRGALTQRMQDHLYTMKSPPVGSPPPRLRRVATAAFRTATTSIDPQQIRRATAVLQDSAYWDSVAQMLEHFGSSRESIAQSAIDSILTDGRAGLPIADARMEILSRSSRGYPPGGPHRDDGLVGLTTQQTKAIADALLVPPFNGWYEGDVLWWIQDPEPLIDHAFRLQPTGTRDPGELRIKQLRYDLVAAYPAAVEACRTLVRSTDASDRRLAALLLGHGSVYRTLDPRCIAFRTPLVFELMDDPDPEVAFFAGFPANPQNKPRHTIPPEACSEAIKAASILTAEELHRAIPRQWLRDPLWDDALPQFFIFATHENPQTRKAVAELITSAVQRLPQNRAASIVTSHAATINTLASDPDPTVRDAIQAAARWLKEQPIPPNPVSKTD